MYCGFCHKKLFWYMGDGWWLCRNCDVEWSCEE